MALLQLQEAEKKIVDQIILQEASLQIQPGEMIGLIGLNGVGKTTLFRILTGMEALDSGRLITKKDLSMGYMVQDFFTCQEADVTLYDFILQVFTELIEMEDDIRLLEEKMGELQAGEGSKEYEQVMSDYSRLTQRFQQQGGYEYESRIRGVLSGLGFSASDYHRELESLSGGEKSRAALGRLLLQEPELLLLDEPTNHLDISAQEWLEEYLSNYSQAVVIISHDRYLLDRLVDRIWELEQGRLSKYAGNYSFYWDEKQRRLSIWKKEYSRQQEKIEKMEEYIRRNHAGNNARQARSRQKQLDNMEQIPPPPSEPALPGIFFPEASPSVKKVLEVEDLWQVFNDSGEEKKVLKGVNLYLERGEKVVLLGDNGSGKTVLINTLMGIIPPTSGSINYGKRVKKAYYLQEQENLTPDNNLVQELRSAARISYEEARNILGRFLFDTEDCRKLIRDLSGGERSRFALARLTVIESNLLMMDEPTNHLDILSRSVLEEALKDYSGTMVVISHDRYFIDQIADKIWELDDGKVREYDGNYSKYRYYKERERKESKRIERGGGEKKGEQQRVKRKKEVPSGPDLSQVEERIMSLEGIIAELEEEFGEPGFYEQSGEVIEEKNRKYHECRQELNSLYLLWEEAVD